MPLIGGMLKNAAKMTKTAGIAVGRAYASRKLASNLEKSGIVRPVDSAAHHVVAFGAAKAAPARDILERYGIDINSADNGVFLGSQQHGGLHTGTYYDEVNARLSGVNSRQEVLEVLKDISTGLQNGTFPK